MTPALATPLPSHIAAVAPRAGTSDLAGAHERARNFDSQLDAARQQHKQEPDAQRPRHDDVPRAAKPQSAAPTADKLPAVKDKSGAAAPAPAADPSTEPAAGPTSPLLASDATADDKSDTAARDKDDAGTNAAAGSLVGMILALLPTAVAALQSGSDGTNAKGGASAQGITMAAAGVDAAQSALDDANAALPAVAAKELLAGNGAPSALAASVLAALDAGRDPARDQNGITALLAAPTISTPSPVLMLPVQAPVGSAAFGQELGQQVAWLSSQAGQGLKQASIRLHPEELGQLDIKVSVKHDRVDVIFSAQHPGAVTAVQQTLPQLNHLLAQHGLSLGHTEVGQQQHNDAPKDSRDSVRSVAGIADSDDVHASGMPMTVSRIGLLDAFA